MKIINENKQTTVNHGGVDYTSDQDGVFDLPDEVAEYITAFPGWWGLHDYQRHVVVEEQEKRTEPDILADRIQALEDRVTALESKPKVGRPPKTQ